VKLTIDESAAERDGRYQHAPGDRVLGRRGHGDGRGYRGFGIRVSNPRLVGILCGEARLLVGGRQVQMQEIHHRGEEADNEAGSGEEDGDKSGKDRAVCNLVRKKGGAGQGRVGGGRTTPTHTET
jgi:hypothetical protein